MERRSPVVVDAARRLLAMTGLYLVLFLFTLYSTGWVCLNDHVVSLTKYKSYFFLSTPAYLHVKWYIVIYIIRLS